MAVYEEVGLGAVSAMLATPERECERRGVEFRTDTTVTGVRTDGDGVAGVGTEFGPVDAEAVVAAGVMAGPAIGVVVRSPVTGEAAAVQADAFALDRFDPRGRDFAFATLRN